MMVACRYNAKDEQVWKRAIGVVDTYTMYDEAGHWLGEYDASGAVQQAIWLDDLPVGLIANGNQLHYIEPDHLGTPRVVIELARNVPVWTWDLKGEAFGSSAPIQNPDGDPNPSVFNLRFPGQRYDSTTGLNYNYFRDYEASSGRYVEGDPMGLFGGGASIYAYAAASPLRNVDSLGLKWVVGGQLGNGDNRGAIVCKNGKVTFEFQNYEDNGCQELSDAAIAHENLHLKDIDNSVCNCAKDGSFVSNDVPSERLDSERKAFNGEMAALKRAKSRSNSNACRRVIEARIKDIEERLLPCVNSGAYPKCPR